MTLPQVLSWIIYRDRCLIGGRASIFPRLDNADAEAGNDKEKAALLRSKCFIEAPTIFDVLNDAIREADNDEAMAKAALQARDQLILKLKTGAASAYGVRQGKHLHSAIAPEHWERLDFFPEGNLGSNDVGCDGVSLYSDVRLERAQVEALWPAPVKPGTKRGPGRPKEKREVVKAKMLRDHNAGVVDLANEKEEVLGDRYGCARGTAVAARDEVLLEISSKISNK
jgi:hypothetical protein